MALPLVGAEWAPSEEGSGEGATQVVERRITEVAAGGSMRHVADQCQLMAEGIVVEVEGGRQPISTHTIRHLKREIFIAWVLYNWKFSLV